MEEPVVHNPMLHSFEDLNLRPNLIKGVYCSGFNRPSKIQREAIPLLLNIPPRNIIVQSQTGTGKTVAFGLAMLTRVDPTKPYPQVICLSPSVPLAMQTDSVLEQIAQYCPEIKIACTVNNGFAKTHAKKVTEHILIGTVETVMDLVVKGKFDPERICMFVLDEADVMMKDSSVRSLMSFMSPNCQHVLFSSTYSDEVMAFASSFIANPNIIRLTRSEESLSNIRQYSVLCSAGDPGKLDALLNLCGVLTIGQCIVFCHTRSSALWLESGMRSEFEGLAVSAVTDDDTIEHQTAVLNGFHEGKERLMITNTCLRGMDFKSVNLVVNYNIPLDANGQPDFESYIRQIGRAGRFGKFGVAVNFIDRLDRMLLLNIEQHFQHLIMELDANHPEDWESIIMST